MSARSIGTGTISFGMVSIPIRTYSAGESSSAVSFNLLDGKTKTRLKQQYISSSGEIVPRDQMVKGYEFSKDQYVTFTSDELKSMEQEAQKAIEITEFVPAAQVDPIYFDKPYYLGPDKGGEKAFRLLNEAMKQTGRVALAKWAARGKQYLVMIRPKDKGLVMQQLLYADEVKSIAEVPIPEAEIKEAELKLATQIIEQIANDEFHPEHYEDEVRKRYHEAIQRKVEGQEITAAPEAPRAQIIDLMEALKASLAKKSAAPAAAAPAPAESESESEAATGTEGRPGPASAAGERAQAVFPRDEAARVAALPVEISGVARDSLARVGRDVVECERCPRLRAWCEDVARVKVKRFLAEDYWGRPIPGFGDPRARLLVIGLAPAAHGGNRTGRVFTGDRSGDFLFAALHRAGFASQPTSVSRDDGLRLEGAYIAPLARCAPPANKPTPGEIENCREYLLREWALLPAVRAVLALGRVAMDGFVALLRDAGRIAPRARFAFGHGVAHDLGGGLRLFASYHPSQQNTFTGKLTPRGFDAVMKKINRHLDRGGGPGLRKDTP